MTTLTHVNAALTTMPHSNDITPGDQDWRNWHYIQEALRGIKVRLMTMETKE